MLGRPRFRGGSPRALRLSDLGDRRVEAPLSLLYEAVLAARRGWIARGARIGLSAGRRGRLRAIPLSNGVVDEADGSWRPGGKDGKLGLTGNGTCWHML